MATNLNTISRFLNLIVEKTIYHLSHSDMYAMKVVALSIFCNMMFPHNGKIVSLDQLTYYDPKPQTNLDNVFPTIGGNKPVTFYTDVGPSVFKGFTLHRTYHGRSPHVPSIGSSLMCTITLSNHPLATPSSTSGA